MDPFVGLLIYVAITTVSAVLWHRYLPDYVGATLAATATTVALFLFVDYLQSGHWARNMEIAVLITSVPAAFISLLIGLPLFLARRKARGKGSAL